MILKVRKKIPQIFVISKKNQKRSRKCSQDLRIRLVITMDLTINKQMDFLAISRIISSNNQIHPIIIISNKLALEIVARPTFSTQTKTTQTKTTQFKTIQIKITQIKTIQTFSTNSNNKDSGSWAESALTTKTTTPDPKTTAPNPKTP